MADKIGSPGVHLVGLEEPQMLAASFSGNLTQESMQRSIRAIEDALRVRSAGWLLFRTHDVESMDDSAADELAAWLHQGAENGSIFGVGYCPHSDVGEETRSDVYRAMLEIAETFPGEWCQGPRVAAVLAAVAALAKTDA